MFKGWLMMVDTMMTSDFEFDHAFPVKTEIVGFIPFEGQKLIFFDQNLEIRIHRVQKWMLFFRPPTHFRLISETWRIIDEIRRKKQFSCSFYLRISFYGTVAELRVHHPKFETCNVVNPVWLVLFDVCNSIIK